MTLSSPQTLRQIQHLLHDANVQDLSWDRALATFVIRFDCLRRNADGTDMQDRFVEFRLSAVQAVLVGYDPADPQVRPSQFTPPGRIGADQLAEWPFRPEEGSLSINSENADDALDSAQRDWLLGDEQTARTSACTFCLFLDRWAEFGMPLTNVRLLIGGTSFSITSGGLPLELDEWTKQFEAWWKGWQHHWDTKDNDEAEESPGEYDAAIPTGECESPDLSYRPPAEPVVDLEPTDAPRELLDAMGEWFESRHLRQWTRLAQVYPCPDVALEERAKMLEQAELGYDFGRWGYPRSIDEWWIEGRRGCLMVRGIEHTMASDGDPAENRESVWTFSLRLRGGSWVIYGWSQGWPDHGSAKKLPARQKPWRNRWKSGLA